MLSNDLLAALCVLSAHSEHGRGAGAARRRGSTRRCGAVSGASGAEGADVNEPQGDGMTALHWAAYSDDVEDGGAACWLAAPVSARRRATGPDAADGGGHVTAMPRRCGALRGGAADLQSAHRTTARRC